MNYPKNSIKGIPNDSFLLEDGAVHAHLFYFQQPRDDGLVEQSINWEDNESVIDFTLNQKKENGDLQFMAGVAILPRSEIDRLSKLSTIRGLLSYERSPLDDNPHHGNLLLQANISKAKMRLIAANLATAISSIITQKRERLF